MMDNNIHSSFKTWWESWIEKKKIRQINMENIIYMDCVLWHIWRARNDEIFKHMEPIGVENDPTNSPCLPRMDVVFRRKPWETSSRHQPSGWCWFLINVNRIYKNMIDLNNTIMNKCKRNLIWSFNPLDLWSEWLSLRGEFLKLCPLLLNLDSWWANLLNA